MDFGITCDAWWETRVSEVINLLPIREMRDEFYGKFYGNDINDIFIVLMCRQPEYNFKPRVRFNKKEKALYTNIMLDFDFFINATQEQRNKKVLDQILVELPVIISKYEFKNFDTLRFIDDIKIIFSKINIKD